MKTCGLCGKPVRGYAAVSTADADGWETVLLCHPDEGLSCYVLWTVHGARAVISPAPHGTDKGQSPK